MCLILIFFAVSFSVVYLIRVGAFSAIIGTTSVRRAEWGVVGGDDSMRSLASRDSSVACGGGRLLRVVWLLLLIYIRRVRNG